MRTARLMLLGLVVLAILAGGFGACSATTPNHHGKLTLAAQQPLAGSASDVVYTTRTGKCYHADGCSSLRKSKIKTTRGDAEKRGYRACRLCNP
jgi:hypothetical protein